MLLRRRNSNPWTASDIDDKVVQSRYSDYNEVEEGLLVVGTAARMLHKASAAATSPRASGTSRALCPIMGVASVPFSRISLC